MKEILDSVQLQDDSVWVLDSASRIAYSDGPLIERHLQQVFEEATDLGSDSEELEARVRDWPSEYYLTRRRRQLLEGFHLDRSQRVLEIGCGCGTVTRFLGEAFDEVVAVEGALNRAKLARLRTKEMENVSVICAPFQELRFREKFDIVFCIGVFEYSARFIDSSDPFDYVLNYFRQLLSPDGLLVLAIENQFGLKYFSSSREDHNNVMFDGLEGYPRYNKERTFGQDEIKRLLEKHFKVIDFYFPYPDYKTPTCVLSTKCFSLMHVAEILGTIPQDRYRMYPQPLFDERFVLWELEKNAMLPFFSNSFLIVAGQGDPLPMQLDSLGVYFSTWRKKELQTVTRFVETGNGAIIAKKSLLSGMERVESGPLTLHPTDSPWKEGGSLHTQVLRRAKQRGATIESLFSPCRLWVDSVKSLARHDKGEYVLSGTYFDCVWKNTYVEAGQCVFIDQEWEWKQDIKLGILLIRCMYEFLNDTGTLSDPSPSLKSWSMKRLMMRIASSLGVELTRADFNQFCAMEAEVQSAVHNKDRRRILLYVRLGLWNRRTLHFFLALDELLRRALRKVGKTALLLQAKAHRDPSGTAHTN